MASRPSLDEIRQQIDAGKKAEARRALSSALYRDSKNAEAWWLYAQVAENKTQLYNILTVLTDESLPSNPYTARARAWLVRLPFQQTKSASGLGGGSGKYSVGLTALLVLVAILMVVSVGVVVTVMAGSPSGTVPQPSGVANLPERKVNIVVVTLAERPTYTPMATVTPWPTTTPRPTATPLPVTATATSTAIPHLADVLPGLRDVLASRTDSLYKLADAVSAQLQDIDNFSPKTVQSTLDQVSKIQALRNEVILTNLSAIPADVSQHVVIPAQNAYMGYANNLLYWIDLQLEANRLYKGLETVPANELKVAQQRWVDQKDLANKQAALVTNQRNVLSTALIAYSVEAMQVTLQSKASDKAITISSDNPGTLKLNDGVYQVYYFVQAANDAAADKVSIKLKTVSSVAPPVELFNGSKQKPSDTVILTFQNGIYQVQPESSAWWVMVFDPRS